MALRTAAWKLQAQNGMRVDPDQVIVTNGLTHASCAASIFIDPGDEMILLEPYDPQHIGKIELPGGKVFLAALAANKAMRWTAGAWAIWPRRKPAWRLC